jgi:hypothetical protein
VRGDGEVDVLYLAYSLHRPHDALGSGREYLVRGNDGPPWSPPISVGSHGPPIGEQWWIDGSISSDEEGDLYATWDTQQPGKDVGWLSYSLDGGSKWSPPIRVTPDNDSAAHIVEVVGAKGRAYIAWLTNAAAPGYAMYLRAFSIKHGWLSRPILVSRRYGRASVWPGDTFGLSLVSQRRLVISWGGDFSAGHGGKDRPAEVVATVVHITA